MSRNRNIKRVTSRTNVDKKNIKSENKIVLRTSDILEKEQDKHKIAEYGFKNAYVELKYEEEETYRTNLRRQRDKILYTGGFRRLQDKTQVLSATKTGDHRTRLTHTLEVEQIAVSIADALGLNTDLVSAIALGHDVGHTPFGHAGERKLDELLKDDGRFHHPIQSVKYIWQKYGDKISNEVYEGILKHDSDMFVVEKDEVEDQIKYMHYKVGNEKKMDEEFRKYIMSEINKFPSTLEAQIVIWSDKIAYITHDLEDYLNVKKDTWNDLMYKNDSDDLLNDELKKLIKILKEIVKKDKEYNNETYDIRDIIRTFTSSLIEGSKRNIDNYMLEKLDEEKLKEIINEVGKDGYTTDELENIFDEIVKKINSEKNDKTYDIRDIIRTLTSSLIDGSKNNVDENVLKKIDKEKLKEKLKEVNKNACKDRYKLDDDKKYKDSIKKKEYLKALIINFNSGKIDNYFELRKFLDEHYIFSNLVQRSDAKASKIVKNLFVDFTENTKLLPTSFNDNLANIEEFASVKYDKEIIKKFKNKVCRETDKSYIEYWDKLSPEDKNEMEKKFPNLRKEIDKNKETETIKKRVVANYISTMSDSYAITLYSDLNAISDNFNQ